MKQITTNEAFSLLKSGRKFKESIFDNLRSDKNVVIHAAIYDGSATKHMDVKFLDDEDVARNAVFKNGFTLLQFSESIQNNVDIVIEAINKHPKVYNYLSDEMKGNYEVVQALLSDNDEMIDDTPDEIQETIFKYGIDKFFDMVQCLPPKIKDIQPQSSYSELDTIEKQIAELQNKANLLKTNRANKIIQINSLIKELSIKESELTF